MFSGSRNEAEVIRGVLESAGIPTVIGHSGAGAAYGVTVGPLGQSTVSVDSARAEDAKALLDDLQPDESDAAVEPRRAGVIRIVSIFVLIGIAMATLMSLARDWMSL